MAPIAFFNDFMTISCDFSVFLTLSLSSGLAEVPPVFQNILRLDKTPKVGQKPGGWTKLFYHHLHAWNKWLEKEQVDEKEVNIKEKSVGTYRSASA